MTPSDDTTMPVLPRSFLEEIKALYGDVHEDYAHSILGTDPEVHAFFRTFVIGTMSSGRDPNLIIDDLATSFVWMIMLGREHATQGLPAPVPRDDVEGLDLITDDQISQLIDDELNQ